MALEVSNEIEPLQFIELNLGALWIYPMLHDQKRFRRRNHSDQEFLEFLYYDLLALLVYYFVRMHIQKYKRKDEQWRVNKKKQKKKKNGALQEKNKLTHVQIRMLWIWLEFLPIKKRRCVNRVFIHKVMLFLRMFTVYFMLFIVQYILSAVYCNLRGQSFYDKVTIRLDWIVMRQCGICAY